MRRIKTELTKVPRLTKEERKAAGNLSDFEIRCMVSNYYESQDARKRSDQQIKSVGDRPLHDLTHYMANTFANVEADIAKLLDEVTTVRPIGRWMKAQVGIGPIVAAGLLAHIDIKRCPTVGHIWRFAGLDPSRIWRSAESIRTLIKEARAQAADDVAAVRAVCAILNSNPQPYFENEEIFKESKGKSKVVWKEATKRFTRRPWNAALKTICWHAGQGFMKNAASAACFYGHVYRDRKAYEVARNDSGGNAALAEELVSKFGKDTEAHGHLEGGKLPPAQIDARARRYAVKIFLSHMHMVWYALEFKELPPKPFCVEHLGHAHVIQPPRLDVLPEVMKLIENSDVSYQKESASIAAE